ncbi:hypothetical protein Bbelb_118510 [Branchiostoma belcheri]|nr:hypothetical protein Bbelb_118510 [Branchiostoma belcheri]
MDRLTSLQTRTRTSSLKGLVQDAPQYDITIVLTDANATLCQASRSASPQNVLGPISADPSTNDNVSRLLDLCRATNMSIADSWFPRKRIHHWTWYSPDGRTRKAIDHILISARWKSYITNCRVYRGAQLANTDHRLLVAHVRMKLKADPTAKKERRIDSAQLLDPLIQEKYMCSISNRFNALTQDETADWQSFKTEVLKPLRSRGSRTRLSTSLTAGEPHAFVGTRLSTDASTESGTQQSAETEKPFGQIKLQAWRKPRNATTNISEGRPLKKRRSSLIKDTAGNILSSEEDCITRWREHFSQLLNHPPVPEDPDLKDAADAADDSNTDSPTPPVTPDEVRTALRKLENGKAPGICKITAEMLKAGGDHIVKWLTQIINHVWIQERIPEDWRRGVILPFWKRKGDQLVCSNHREDVITHCYPLERISATALVLLAMDSAPRDEDRAIHLQSVDSYLDKFWAVFSQVPEVNMQLNCGHQKADHTGPPQSPG